MHDGGMEAVTHMQLPDIMVAPGLDPNQTGVLLYWSMRGGAAEHGTVCAALADAGFLPEHHPPLPTPKTAFARAVESLTTSTRFMRRGKTPNTFFLIDEDISDDIELTKNIKLRLGPGGVVIGDGDDPGNLVAKVVEAYERALHQLTHRDVLLWLTKQLDRLLAVSLRPGGGFYFVPADEVLNWRKLVTALRASTAFKFYELPAMRTDDSLEAILDAITREAETEIAAVRNDLTGGRLKAKGLHTRAQRCERMCEKVERYEKILGQGLDGIRDQLGQLEAASVTAALQAEMGGDDA